MKKLIFLFAILFSTAFLHAQETPPSKLAKLIADKMQASLGLTNQQQAKVFQVNMELAKQKEKARKKSPDLKDIQQQIQLVEGFRDQLYKEFLSPDQYRVYLEKKGSLVSAD